MKESINKWMSQLDSVKGITCSPLSYKRNKEKELYTLVSFLKGTGLFTMMFLEKKTKQKQMKQNILLDYQTDIIPV